MSILNGSILSSGAEIPVLVSQEMAAAASWEVCNHSGSATFSIVFGLDHLDPRLSDTKLLTHALCDPNGIGFRYHPTHEAILRDETLTIFSNTTSGYVLDRIELQDRRGGGRLGARQSQTPASAGCWCTANFENGRAPCNNWT